MPAPLKVGLNVAFIKPEALVEVTKAAEQMGYESVWLGEHVALPKDGEWWRGYPSNPQTESDMTFRPENLWLEPLTVMAHLAGVTEHMRFGIGIYMMALRNPVLLARTLATVDVLSNGRLDFGIGLGWSPAEYEISGVPFKERGRRTDDGIRCLRALFDPADDFPEYHGEFIDFPRIGFLPKPIQNPFPIHVGGFSAAGTTRAARYGNGYYGPASFYPAVREALAAEGRSGERFEFSTSIPTEADTTLAMLESLAAAGGDRAIVQPWQHHVPMGMEVIDRAESFAKTVGMI